MDKKEKIKDIKRRLVDTNHAKDNRNFRRPHITEKQIVEAIAYGIKTLSKYRTYKVEHKGICVIYKIDRYENIVVITYYYKNKNKKKSDIFNMFADIN